VLTSRINEAIVTGVRRDGRMFFSSTMIGGRFTLRLVSLHLRTHLRMTGLALQVLREQVTAVGE